jgi:hypothetical protein
MALNWEIRKAEKRAEMKALMTVEIEALLRMKDEAKEERLGLLSYWDSLMATRLAAGR